MKKNIAFCAVAMILFFSLAGCSINNNATDPQNVAATPSTLEENVALQISPDTPAVPAGRLASVRFENTAWQVVSLAPEDYGIVYDVNSMEFEQFPLDKLMAYYLGSDGAYAEGSSEELYRRFLEAPNTVLTYIALFGDDVATNRHPDDIPARVIICRAIACADVFWHDITDSFSTILEQLDEVYPSGSIADVLVYLKYEYDAAIERA